MKNVTATSRWTASFLLLVMLVPAFGPFAMARLAPPDGMHCMRRPLSDAPAAEPATHCHHAAAKTGASPNAAGQTTQPASEASFRAINHCCPNHDCCRGAVISEWAQPAVRYSSYLSLLVERTLALRSAASPSSAFAGIDSARAPPLS